MASIEYIQKRIEGKQKEVAKLTAKLERINKAKSTNWEVNPYYYHEDDLRWTTKDLEAATEALRKYEDELVIANEKAESRNVEAILKFLEMWKANVTKFYHDTSKAYPEALEQYYEDMKPYQLGYFKERTMEREDPEAWVRYRTEKKSIQESFKFRFGFVEPYMNRTWTMEGTAVWSFDDEKLKKELDEEANRKYDFIIERTNKIVGKITDASGLKVGAKQDLNGYIVGTKGIAKVQTIGAGGYNIQCYHFRTLINPVK